MTIPPPTADVLNNIKLYLLSRGWLKIDHPNRRIEVLETQPDSMGGFYSIALPSSPEFRDAGQMVEEVVRTIADFEKSSIQKVVDHVLRWNRDILRTRFLKMLGIEHTLPLGIAADAVSGLKEFLGYAAYTQSNPRPFFDKAGSVSGEFTRHCVFGHTFNGSFGLTIECPLAMYSSLNVDGIEEFVPIERLIFERMANGFATLRESIGKDSIDPMLVGYSTGFSANMCRKLAEIYEKADGRRIEYDISWSPQYQSKCERAWQPVLFDGRAYDFSRVAASELEKAEIIPDSMIEGRIVILKSEMPPGLDEQAEFDHVITMPWEREKGQIVRIRVPLSPVQYIQACDAHKEGKPIRIYGIPEKSGKFWVLTKPHDFVVLSE